MPGVCKPRMHRPSLTCCPNHCASGVTITGAEGSLPRHTRWGGAKQPRQKSNEHKRQFDERATSSLSQQLLLWIRLFATKAVGSQQNREDRQTNRQTMYRDYRRENRERNSYKRDIAILVNSQKTILRKERVLSPDVRLPQNPKSHFQQYIIFGIRYFDYSCHCQ